MPQPARVSPNVPAAAKSVEGKFYSISTKPFQPPPQRDDDDWCMLFDTVGDKPLFKPTGIK